MQNKQSDLCLIESQESIGDLFEKAKITYNLTLQMLDNQLNVTSNNDDKTSKAAAEYLKKNIPCSGHNYLICDEKESFNVETSGLRCEITKHVQGEGFSFHTNHFLGKLQEIEITERISKTSKERYAALDKYFTQNKVQALTPAKLTHDLFESEESNAICIKPSKDPHGSATCGGIYYDWKTKQGCIFAGLYSENDRRLISNK